MLKKINLIKLEVKNANAFLKLSAPPKNEMNGDFFNRFNQVISELKSRRDLKGLIILSEGRHFSSGANVEELVGLFNNGGEETPQAILNNKLAFDELQKLPMPVVACVKGICYGSGLELALNAHFRIATANCLMSLPESSFGIIPGLGGVYNSVKSMGSAKTLEFVLSEQTISGVDALNGGLIDILAEKHKLEEKAIELIDLIHSNYRKELKAKYLLDFENNAK